MSGIKRFNHGFCEYPGGIFSEMNQEADGDYVLHSDHEAEVARLRAHLEKSTKAALDAVALSCEKGREADALRVDAERYRWIRDNEELNKGPHPVYFPDGFNEPTQSFIGGSRLDELVDAAMGASA